jgi:hypothetical protein
MIFIVLITCGHSLSADDSAPDSQSNTQGIAQFLERIKDLEQRVSQLEASVKQMRPIASVPHATQSQTVYQSRFVEEGIDDAWTAEEFHVSVYGRPAYVGRLHNDEAMLTLDDLPEHAFASISLDLLIFRSWDGSIPGDGPDRVIIELDGERTLLDATFAMNVGPVPWLDGLTRFSQSFPGLYPYERYEPRTGAAALHWDGVPRRANIYKLRFVVPHTGQRLQVKFTGQLREILEEKHTIYNESWGLANVEVAVFADSPVELSDERFERLWTRMRGRDPVDAHEALWDLAAAGPAVCALLERKPPFVRVEDATKRIPGLQGEMTEQAGVQSAFHSRLRHLLHVIGGPRARQLRTRVPEPERAILPRASAATSTCPSQNNVWNVWVEPTD